MVIIRRCCCCISLRIGTYMAAVFSLIIGSLGVIECVLLLLATNNEQEKTVANHIEDDEQNNKSLNITMVDMSVHVLKITLYVAIGLFGAWILFSTLVVFGVICRKRCMLLPWIVFTGIIMGLCVWSVISNAKTFVFVAERFRDPHETAVLTTQIVSVFINFYALCVVSSFYRNDLKEYDNEFSSIPTMAPAGVDDDYVYKEQ